MCAKLDISVVFAGFLNQNVDFWKNSVSRFGIEYSVLYVALETQMTKMATLISNRGMRQVNQETIIGACLPNYWIES